MEQEIARLRAEVAELKAQCATKATLKSPEAVVTSLSPLSKEPISYNHSLTKSEVERFSRQLVLPSFGIEGQERLCRGSVLIIGCGGLGSPAALYLAAAGVGRIGLVDRDVVEVSNLHRQIIHTTASAGMAKVESAAAAVRALNPLVQVDVYGNGITPRNVLDIVGKYDVILDATDNPASRYLINDACVVCGKPLVSAASVGTDGQLTVYNFNSSSKEVQACPCYRCVFPESPAAGNCARCSDAGVLGVVPGVMGTLQALEAVKILAYYLDPVSKFHSTRSGESLEGVDASSDSQNCSQNCSRNCSQNNYQNNSKDKCSSSSTKVTNRAEILGGKLLIFDALAGKFSTVRLRGRSPKCVVCGDNPTIQRGSLPDYDYETFTGQPSNDGPPKPLRVLAQEERLTPMAAWAMLTEDAGELDPKGYDATKVSDSGLDLESESDLNSDPKSKSKSNLQKTDPEFLVIDVRPENQIQIVDLQVKLDQDKRTRGKLSYEYVVAPYLKMQAQSVLLDSVVQKCLGGDFRREAAEADGQVEGGGDARPGDDEKVIDKEVLVLCRRGNHSQLAVRLLKDAIGKQVGRDDGGAFVVRSRKEGSESHVTTRIQIRDIEGGITAWAEQVHKELPIL